MKKLIRYLTHICDLNKLSLNTTRKKKLYKCTKCNKLLTK